MLRSATQCFIGRVIEAAQGHFINATPTVIAPSETAEFEELGGDLVEGLEVIEGAIRLPADPV
jgi:hypothetical protein